MDGRLVPAAIDTITTDFLKDLDNDSINVAIIKCEKKRKEHTAKLTSAKLQDFFNFLQKKLLEILAKENEEQSFHTTHQYHGIHSYLILLARSKENSAEKRCVVTGNSLHLTPISTGQFYDIWMITAWAESPKTRELPLPGHEKPLNDRDRKMLTDQMPHYLRYTPLKAGSYGLRIGTALAFIIVLTLALTVTALTQGALLGIFFGIMFGSAFAALAIREGINKYKRPQGQQVARELYTNATSPQGERTLAPIATTGLIHAGLGLDNKATITTPTPSPIRPAPASSPPITPPIMAPAHAAAVVTPPSI